jgi:ABC-type Zn uptake system ZnuABC Zn-binding protein ZnuA
MKTQTCNSRRARRPAHALAAFAVASLILTACGAGGDQTADTVGDAPVADGTPATTVTTTAAADDASAPDTQAAVETRLNIVVSDPPIADLVSRVGGPEVAVTSVVPLGADGHTYEPRPGDARALADADAFIENGMELNLVVSDFAATNYPEGTPHFELSDVIPEAEVIATDTAEQIAAHGHAHSFNAHFWPDPVYAIAYVERISEILVGLDPDRAGEYETRAAELRTEIEAMDAAFAEALETIPVDNRKLVVYHDSWSYFGRRYGVPVLGAIQPVDFSEPSAAELRDTIDQVREAAVPAFFGSEVFPSDVLEVIAAETGAQYVADLSDDRMPGEPGAPEHSYVGMMVANVRTIVGSLGGDPGILDSVDPALS